MPARGATGLRSRIAVVVSFAILPALILILTTGVADRRHRAREALLTTQTTARFVLADYSRTVEGVHQLVESLASVPDLREHRPGCRAILAGVMRSFPRYSNLGVAAPNGEVVCSALQLSRPVNIVDRAYFQRAVQTRDFAAGDYQLGRITGVPGINFAHPATDDRGNVVAVIVAALDLGWLGEFAAETRLGPEAELFVVDTSGTVLAQRPDPGGWVGRSLRETPLSPLIGPAAEGTAELTGPDGVRRLYGFASIEARTGGSVMRVIVGTPRNAVLAEANRLLARNLIGLAFVTLLALGAARGFGEVFLLRRLRAVIGAAERLRQGDLSARASIRDRGGELGRLSSAFDAMAEEIERRNAEEKAAAELIGRAFEREQAAAERLRALEAMKSAFLTHTSHELRTPLTTLVGTAETLVSHDAEITGGARMDLLSRLASSARRLDRLIADLLDVDRLARGVLILHESETDLGELVRRVAAATAPEGHDLTIEAERAVLSVDAPQVERIVENLLANAVRHTPEGTRIWLTVRSAPGGAEIGVADDGPGVPPGLRDAAFAPLEQGPTIHPHHPGMGIGLALVARLAELHGGRAWIEDRPGGGTSARVFLPAG
ncbi:MAG: sensor histidine kinase [Acidobacteria bacterium]|nr:sensor histidine kinase [Acidobacteriota bacterium]